MKMKLIYVAMVMAALVNVAPAARGRGWGRWTTTAGPSTKNLNWKMFTLSRDRGGISFFPPYYYPGPSTPLYTTYRPYTTTARPYIPSTTRPYIPTTTRPYIPTTRHHHTTTYPPWTTAPPTRGVSVCLRYLTDLGGSQMNSLFKLSKSRSPLELQVSYTGSYRVLFGWQYVDLKPSIRLWKYVEEDIWNAVCITVDSVKNVAQVFTPSRVSIRKTLPSRYVWSGEPVIDFSGFDGQVTDVQMWDYPLSYREAQSYVRITFGPTRGSVLTWSSISYAPRGDVLLEDVYELQAGGLIGKRRKGLRRKEKANERQSERRNRLK